jgi:tRNA A-37 threonylcarbamoyl transferase component Bud32
MRARAPWWIWVLASSVLAWFAFGNYLEFLGPEPIQAGYVFRDGRMVLAEVERGGTAERAGLRRGDVLQRVAGIPMHSLSDWMAARAQMQMGQPLPVEFEREGAAQATSLLPQRRVWYCWTATEKTTLIVDLLVRLAVLGMAFLILWQRGRDTAAVMGAWLLALSVAGLATVVTGMGATWRALPPAVAWFLLFGFLSNACAPAILFTFFATFPRRLFRSKWWWLIPWAPVPLLLLLMLPNDYRVAYHPESLGEGIPAWELPVLLVALSAYLVAGVVAMVVNYRRLSDINERRRMRVVVAGGLVSWIVGLPAIIGFNLPSGHWFARVMLATPVQIPVIFALLFFPVALTYAVLRHRMFDVRVIVRQGLQYAVARRALVAAVPVLAGLLVLDLITHRQQTIGEALRARGWIYVVIGGVALTAHSRRERWLGALDRRFFRERYDAQRLLREVLEDVRQAASLDAVAPVVTAKIEAALHPECAMLLAREPGQPCYRALACAPASARPLEVQSETKLMGLLRLLEKPLEVSSGESSWWREQLPHDETQWLRESRVELLIPVALVAEQREVLLVLGPKRSEEPYSREDKEFLLSIGGSLRLLLERPAVAVAVESSFRECPECGLCASSATSACAADGVRLAVTAAPRLLAGRYRLDRRIGRGGMGTVYAARDTALERDVAAKLMREELVANASAAHRFQQEARAAAAFAHRHVVTIHDYGVAGTRAFLIMELLAGRSLREEIRQHGALSPERAMEVFRGVCGAVEAAHRRGLIHRDLKPENVFLTRSDEGEIAKVLDFGLVKSVTDETRLSLDTPAASVIGTLPYLSPELWGGAIPDAGVDCWALAVTMYEALQGEHPFPATSAQELRSAVLAGQYKRLPQSAWEEFFGRALAAERQKRPASASALFAELERALRQPGARSAHAAR